MLLTSLLQQDFASLELFLMCTSVSRVFEFRSSTEMLLPSDLSTYRPVSIINSWSLSSHFLDVVISSRVYQQPNQFAGALNFDELHLTITAIYVCRDRSSQTRSKRPLPSHGEVTGKELDVWEKGV